MGGLVTLLSPRYLLGFSLTTVVPISLLLVKFSEDDRDRRRLRMVLDMEASNVILEGDMGGMYSVADAIKYP
jgi:hypothetical protein